MFNKKVVLRNFAIFTGKQVCWSLFLIRLQPFGPATLLERHSKYRCFPVYVAKCFRKPILKKHLRTAATNTGLGSWVPGPNFRLCLSSFYHFIRHSLESGPETWNPRPWDPGPWELEPGTLSSGTIRPEILGPKTKFVAMKHLYPIKRVTLTAHFITEYKKAPVNTVNFISSKCNNARSWYFRNHFYNSYYSMICF